MFSRSTGSGLEVDRKEMGSGLEAVRKWKGSVQQIDRE